MDVPYMVAHAMKLIGQHNYHEALSVLNKTIQVNPKSPIAFQCRALCKSALSDCNNPSYQEILEGIISDLETSLGLTKKLLLGLKQSAETD